MDETAWEPTRAPTGECPPPVPPTTVPCSGLGTCANGTCVCPWPMGGHGDVRFAAYAKATCDVHGAAVQAMWVFVLLTALVLLGHSLRFTFLALVKRRGSRIGDVTISLGLLSTLFGVWSVAAASIRAGNPVGQTLGNDAAFTVVWCLAFGTFWCVVDTYMYVFLFINLRSIAKGGGGSVTGAGVVVVLSGHGGAQLQELTRRLRWVWVLEFLAVVAPLGMLGVKSDDDMFALGLVFYVSLVVSALVLIVLTTTWVSRVVRDVRQVLESPSVVTGGGVATTGDPSPLGGKSARKRQHHHPHQRGRGGGGRHSPEDWAEREGKIRAAVFRIEAMAASLRSLVLFGMVTLIFGLWPFLQSLSVYLLPILTFTLVVTPLVGMYTLIPESAWIPCFTVVAKACTSSRFRRRLSRFRGVGGHAVDSDDEDSDTVPAVPAMPAMPALPNADGATVNPAFAFALAANGVDPSLPIHEENPPGAGAGAVGGIGGPPGTEVVDPQDRLVRNSSSMRSGLRPRAYAALSSMAVRMSSRSLVPMSSSANLLAGAANANVNVNGEAGYPGLVGVGRGWGGTASNPRLMSGMSGGMLNVGGSVRSGSARPMWPPPRERALAAVSSSAAPRGSSTSAETFVPVPSAASASAASPSTPSRSEPHGAGEAVVVVQREEDLRLDQAAVASEHHPRSWAKSDVSAVRDSAATDFALSGSGRAGASEQ